MLKRYKWFLVAVVGLMIGAPNGTVVRAAVLESDPYYLTFCRFALVAVICLPFMLKARTRILSKRARKDVLLASLFLSIALTCYTFALLYSQASYVTIISLASPIIFIVLSAKFFGERVNRRVATGVTLAMIGAMTLVVLPLAFSQNGTAFYPLATVLALGNCVTYMLALIYMRRANEHGVGMPAMVGASALFVALFSLILFLIVGDTAKVPNDVGFWGAVLYSGIAAGLIGRVLNVKAFEHIGAGVMSALWYLEMFVAILIPVFVLNEKLSPTMVIGGILILIGVYVVEHHKHPHAKHHIVFRHH